MGYGIATKCDSCNSRNLITNDATGDLVCYDCGVVVEENVFEKTSSGYLGEEPNHTATYGKLGDPELEKRLSKFEVKSSNKAERDNVTIDESSRILGYLNPSRNPNRKQEENRMMKKLRNLNDPNVLGLNKRMFVGYTVELNATVMAWLIHNHLSNLQLSKSQIKSKINQSFENPDFPVSVKKEDRKKLDNCLTKFWNRFKAQKWRKKIHHDDIKRNARNELEKIVATLVNNDTIDFKFSIPESVLGNIMEIEKYPLDSGKVRDSINVELIWHLINREGVKAPSRKKISEATEQSTGKTEHHGKKVSYFLKNVLGD